MCGIAGFVGDCKASTIILAMLKRLEYRGYDSAGVTTITDGKLHTVKTIGVFAPDDKRVASLPGNAGIGHTRWATHGKVSVENAHPHVIDNISVIHNGTILNYQEIKDSLALSGHTFSSETDTEVIPHLLKTMPIGDIAGKLEGDFAILVLDAQSNELTAVKRGCPLLKSETAYGTMIASDTVAFDVLPHSTPVMLQDGEITKIKVDCNPGTGHSKLPVIAQSDVNVPGTHHMLKEIQEQPDMLRRIAETADTTAYTRAVIDLLRAEHMLFTASGTSRYASLIGRYIVSKGTENLGQVIAASEFRYFAEGIQRNMAIVAVSQSGETADVLLGVRAAKHQGARIIAITNYPDSSLGRLADRVIELGCGREIGVAASKTFTAQLAVFYLLLGVMTHRMDDTRQELIHIADCMAQTIKQNEETIGILAEKASKEHDFYYLGRGINFAVAGEAALKMKEVSYVHAEGMAAGELKHGTLALITDRTMVCGICPEDYTYRETQVNLEEVKARNGIVIGITDHAKEKVMDYRLVVPRVPEVYYPMVCVIPAQLLAYYTAIKKGLNPDMPRNLAKSVTVP